MKVQGNERCHQYGGSKKLYSLSSFHWIKIWKLCANAEMADFTSMKKLTHPFAILTLILTTPSWGNDIRIHELVKRSGLY